jgi:hypothetical protein
MGTQNKMSQSLGFTFHPGRSEKYRIGARTVLHYDDPEIFRIITSPHVCEAMCGNFYDPGLWPSYGSLRSELVSPHCGKVSGSAHGI